MEPHTSHDDPTPARMVAGALAHLARHMTTGCPRAAELAALLLERVAEDADADPHLRAHARELVVSGNPIIPSCGNRIFPTH